MSPQTFNDVSQRLRRELPHVRDDVSIIVREIFPSVQFADIWVRPGKSRFGDEIVDIWAVYDDDVADLTDTGGVLAFGTKLQHMLWNRGLDVLPNPHFVAKSEAGDWHPEGL